MFHQLIFGLPINEIGLSSLNLFIIAVFSLFFIISFVISSKNMDSDGIMNWMMTKPKDWIGNKK